MRSDVDSDTVVYLEEVQRRTRLATVVVEPRVQDSGGQVISEAVTHLRAGFRIILEGDAGTGKSTLVGVVVNEMAQTYLNSKSVIVPVLVSASALLSPGDNLWMWLAVAATHGDRLLARALIPALVSGAAYLFVDGLDEVGDPHQLHLVTHALASVCDQSPTLRVCIASRHEGMSVCAAWPEFATWKLMPFDDTQIRKFFAALTASQPAQIERELTQAPRFDAFGASPRTLQMLALYSNAHGLSLPRNRTRLYEDVIDALLELEQRKIQRPFPAKDIHKAHEAIAVAMALAGRSEISTREARAALCNGGSPFGEEATRFLLGYRLERVVMLVQHAPDAMKFVNPAFQDFYLGSAIARDSGLLDALSSADVSEALSFAAGLAADAAPIVRTAYKRHGPALAAFCCNQLQQDQTEVRSILAQLVVDDLGEDFHPILSALTTPPKQQAAANGSTMDEDPFDRLASMWTQMPRRGASADERGRGLERFAVELLGQYFEVVEVRSRHQVGEVDVVCENPYSDPFWAHLSGDVWVECKNTSAKTTIEQVNTFIGKLVGSRCKVGLILSVSGFTRDAMDRIKNLASNPTIPLVAPISGKDIDTLFDHRTELQRFFKMVIRSVT